METDDRYERLERKTIDFKNGSYITKGKIAGCDPNVGITIVVEDDPNIYLLCLVGPSSSLWKESYSKEEYKKLFERIANMLKTGALDTSCFIRAWMGTSPSAEDCPFGQ